jgi:hypothetical protein
MSLKALHLVFVTALSALAFGLGVWKGRDYSQGGSAGDLVFSICAFLVGVLVIWYGKRVLKKLKSISYL